MINKCNELALLKCFFLLTTFPLSFFSLPSFADEGYWTCWGWKSHMEKDKARGSELEYSDDVCVRNNLRPLIVDVYLHKIKYPGKKAHTLDVDIAVKITNKKTNESQFIRDWNKISPTNEYRKRFEFPVRKGGEYNVDVQQIWLTYRKSGIPTGSFCTILKNRSGVTNIETIDTCP